MPQGKGWLKWKERHGGGNLGVPPLFEAGRLSSDLEFCVRIFQEGSIALRNQTVRLDLSFLLALTYRMNTPTPLGQGVVHHLCLVTHVAI